MTPCLFISHGAPSLAIEPAPAREFLTGLGAGMTRPRAIIVATPHWLTDRPTLGAAASFETIHDFYGFPPPLYELRYPAAGAPAVARRAFDLLAAAGLSPALDETRGLDHGVWSPLLLAWPQADIPVVPLSVQPGAPPAHFEAVGRALAPLRDDGVLLIGSGGATHNLAEFRGQPIDAPPPDHVRAFDDWLHDRIVEADGDALGDYRAAAPHAARNHPTDEHLMPLFMAIGAGGLPGRALHRSFTYGVVSMASYAFG